MKKNSVLLIFSIFLFYLCGCEKKPSYAIYAEYARKENKIMKDSLNRRVFDSVEVQSGKDIKLEEDGSITLEPGTYRLTGFSMVTMQSTMQAPAVPADGFNYPGYCMLYPTKYEKDSALIKNIGLGSPCPALNTTPSIFDAVYHTKEKVNISLGHQAGSSLKDTVYLSIYSVDGTASPYHGCARISITKL